MGEVVNLRRARKNRERSDAAAQAAVNRAAFGRTKAERDAIKAEAARRERTLNGAERDR